MIISSLILAFSINFSHGVTLTCEFKNFRSFYGESYTCMVKNFQTTFKDRFINAINGTHTNRLTNEDVKQIFFKYQNIPYLPHNLGAHFPNIETLYVMKSNVQHLMSGDLDGMKNLKIFDVSHNPIEAIGADFFAGHSTIERISFYDCHLKKVANGALDHLTNLHSIYFDHNVCIDLRLDEDQAEADEVKADIYDKCHGGDWQMRSNDTSTCDEVKNERLTQREDKVSDKSSNSTTTLIVLLTITTLLNIVLGVVLFRIFKRNFSGNWHEMRNVLV